ncbi:casparian strip membrane protein 1-like [Nicotiana tabacum]|uniref:CASP-like protein n=1 Tax=Nicotiana tabacum TaxID=4097 RepID=A0A1S4D272_TOBAC|nr:PREDICTED: casparian strip membrane protein 1-like [Nicotiana tabacum]
MKAGAVELGHASKVTQRGVNRGMSILDLFLRIIAIIATLGSAIAMGTTNETLPFFTQFVRFRAKYSDLPTFTFFVVANAIVSAYLVLSLGMSIFHIMRSRAQARLLMYTIFWEVAMMALLTAGASASAAIVYLAHKGNTKTNWFPICQQYDSFCHRTSGSLVGSFIGIIFFILLVLLSALALSRR